MSDTDKPVNTSDRSNAGPDYDFKTPATSLPANSCDSHCHIFGPNHIFPYAPNRTFTPPDVPLADLQRLHTSLGLERALLVQSSCHGIDHAAVIDALERHPARYRGVALLDESFTPCDVAELDEKGFCGVRFNFLKHLGGHPPPNYLNRILNLVKPHGWHVSVHVTGSDLLEIAGFIREIEANVIIDHIGRVDVEEGTNGAAFRKLQSLLDQGNVWVKLSGIDRISKRPPPFEDGVALARTLASSHLERTLWGTDWPHPNVQGYLPKDGDMVDLLPEVLGSDEAIRQVLVDTPSQLFGFAD